MAKRTKKRNRRHDGVPENEYSVMSLAGAVGIEVPETRLVPVDEIAGLPPAVLDGRMADARRDRALVESSAGTSLLALAMLHLNLNLL